MQLTMGKTDIHVISADMHSVLYLQINYSIKINVFNNDIYDI